MKRTLLIAGLIVSSSVFAQENIDQEMEIRTAPQAEKSTLMRATIGRNSTELSDNGDAIEMEGNQLELAAGYKFKGTPAFVGGSLSHDAVEKSEGGGTLSMSSTSINAEAGLSARFNKFSGMVAVSKSLLNYTEVRFSILGLELPFAGKTDTLKFIVGGGVPLNETIDIIAALESSTGSLRLNDSTESVDVGSTAVKFGINAAL